ncbi:MAG: carbon-nitrogen hydrolase family protein [Acidobacteriota bacterium]
MTRLKVAGVQMNPTLMDKERNLSSILIWLRVAAKEGASLVVFPECSLTGYCFESLQEAIPYAEPVPGPSTERVARECQELDVHVIMGLIEQMDGHVYNAAVLIGPGRVIGSYRKVHLPSLGLDKFVSPGNSGFRVHDTPLGRIGMSICYDCNFPESARILALQGADIVVLPTNWPRGAEETAEYLINARGLENRIYYAAVNRVGEERGFRFIGRSRIADIDGRTLAVASSDQEEVLYAEIQPERAREKHIVRVPGKHEIDRFKDRRPELYGLISQGQGRAASGSGPVSW